MPLLVAIRPRAGQIAATDVARAVSSAYVIFDRNILDRLCVRFRQRASRLAPASARAGRSLELRIEGCREAGAGTDRDDGGPRARAAHRIGEELVRYDRQRGQAERRADREPRSHARPIWPRDGRDPRRVTAPGCAPAQPDLARGQRSRGSSRGAGNHALGGNDAGSYPRARAADRCAALVAIAGDCDQQRPRRLALAHFHPGGQRPAAAASGRPGRLAGGPVRDVRPPRAAQWHRRRRVGGLRAVGVGFDLSHPRDESAAHGHHQGVERTVALRARPSGTVATDAMSTLHRPQAIRRFWESDWSLTTLLVFLVVFIFFIQPLHSLAFKTEAIGSV